MIRLGLLVASAFVLCPLSANAVVIVDTPIEAGTGWNPDPVSNPFPGFIGDDLQEGSTAYVILNAANVNGGAGQTASSPNFNTPTFGNLTLQPGTYTVEFSVGSYANDASPIFDVLTLSGLTIDEASSFTGLTQLGPDFGNHYRSTAIPNNWELATVTWDVASDDPRIGDDLQFTWSNATYQEQGVAVNQAGHNYNGLLDGVGPLSGNGNGLVISFEAAPTNTPVIPEPNTLALAGVSLVGLSVVTRRRQRS